MEIQSRRLPNALELRAAHVVQKIILHLVQNVLIGHTVYKVMTT